MTQFARYAAITAMAAAIASTATAKKPENAASVRVVHASPDAPAVDVLVNDILPLVTGLAYGDITGYVDVAPNSYNVKVVPAGAGPGSAVIDADLNLFYDTSYTVVAVDTLGAIAPLVLVDDAGKAKDGNVRFVHASPDAPAVDIKEVDGPFWFQNVSFKGVADYVAVPKDDYDLEVRVAGTDTVVLTLNGVDLKKGNFTVFAVGFAGGDEPALSVLLSEDAE